MSESRATAKAKRLKICFLAAPAPAPDDDPLVAAANPRPSWLLAASEAPGTDLGEWEVWHPLDLVSGETIKLMAIEGQLKGSQGEQYMDRIREQVQLLVPELPDDIFSRLSGHQLLAIGVKAWERPGETRQQAEERKADAANPHNGAGDLAPSSPAPRDASPAGVTET